MHQSLQGATFHLEHIVPRSRSGQTELDNLALACPSCNLKKSDRSDLTDPVTSDAVPIYNPRVHRWDEHFRWVGLRIVGVSAVGRALIEAFDLNHARRLRIREAEASFGLFPP
jgi:hypothetical protein